MADQTINGGKVCVLFSTVVSYCVSIIKMADVSVNDPRRGRDCRPQSYLLLCSIVCRTCSGVGETWVEFNGRPTRSRLGKRVVISL